MRTPSSRGHRFLVAFILLIAGRANATDVIYRGKVMMEDGSPPGRLVSIERVCEGLDHSIRLGSASAKNGEYFVRLDLNMFGGSFGSTDNLTQLPCRLQAVTSGYTSTTLDLTDWKIVSNPRLPTITLTPGPTKESVKIDISASVPRGASRAWAAAVKQLTDHNWTAAETSLRSVVEAAPKFAPAWVALGNTCLVLHKPEEALPALQRAIELNPKSLQPYLVLTTAQIDAKDWKNAAATAGKLIAADTKHDFLQAQLMRAIALYQLQQLDDAFDQLNQAIALDKRHELSRAEYILGVIQEARQDYASATQHLKTYLVQNPRAADLAPVTARLANLGKAPLADLSAEVATADMRLGPAGESPVPGGIKAFSAVAQLRGTPSYQDFFLEYCRAIDDVGPSGTNSTRDAGDAIRAFIWSMISLESLGEQHTDRTSFRLSFGNDDRVRKSRAILAYFGWALTAKGDGYSLEPGEQSIDGFRQWALAALAIDELALREAVAAKRDFAFEIPKESARLLGGAAWGVILKGVPDMAGGPIEAFVRDPRFARVYAGLAAMDGDTSSAVASAIGLTNLIVKYSTLAANYGGALSVSGNRVNVPGGADAASVWNKLAGANPQEAAPFLRALFEKDHGRLLSFYFDLWHADAAHRRYFLASAERAEAYYHWYRDTAPSVNGSRWQTEILQSLALDPAGKALLPGGREAWNAGSESDDELLLHHTPLETVAALASLERKRGTPLSAAAVRILTQHYSQWRSLFPYFEKLPGLDAAEFQALSAFEEHAGQADAVRQNLLAGQWHSLVEMIVLGTNAGSVDATQGARTFRKVCETLQSDAPSTQAVAIVRELAGGTDADEAVAADLLRLNGARRAAFENVKEAQNVPRIASLGNPPDADKTLTALAGIVYAAHLDPADTLVAEDPGLLKRHTFTSPSGGLFAPSALVTSNVAPGTNLSGGFATFGDIAAALRERTLETTPSESAPDAAAASGPLSAESDSPRHVPSDNDLVFRAGGRIVEVYATVTDSRGRYIDTLNAGQFSIMEQGHRKPAFAFENQTAAVSVALVFDTTGSMVGALPPLKNAALQLVNALRPSDSAAVYSFNDKVTELQSFTDDKAAVKRAILKTHAAGVTALYDALVRVNHDLAARTGKKVIIVFTDGSDNASMLTADIAIERAKARGIPIYTIAEGEALTHPALLQMLTNMSQATGGTPFQIHKLSDISVVFEKVSQDLLHGYLIAFQPTPGDNHEWRHIDVMVSSGKGLQIRAREGFYIE